MPATDMTSTAASMLRETEEGAGAEAPAGAGAGAGAGASAGAGAGAVAAARPRLGFVPKAVWANARSSDFSTTFAKDTPCLNTPNDKKRM